MERPRSRTLGCLLILIPLLTACRPIPLTACDAAPALAATASVLAACLAPEATPADAERLLHAWKRVGGEWGGVAQADVLPAAGQELLVRFHADLSQVSWNPQGQFVVLAHDRAAWRVVFDAASLRLTTPQGETWSNWRYQAPIIADLTGDGLDDLLVELIYSNGLHVGLRHLALLTAHDAGPGESLRLAFSADTTLTRPTVRLTPGRGRQDLEMIIAGPTQTPAITRTLSFDGASLTFAAETINPAASSAAAVTSDGAHWYGFDTFDGGGGSPPYSPLLGLYRLQNGRLSHEDVPGVIRVLKVAPDGDLYLGAGCGVWRRRAEQWEALAPLDGAQSTFRDAFFPFDVAFAADGTPWVSGIYALAHWDGAAWTKINIPARRLLVAPDDSVWTEGWDGRADADCCFWRVAGSTWVTYTYSADGSTETSASGSTELAEVLPDSPDLQMRIRALRR